MSKERVALNGIKNYFPCTVPGEEWFPSMRKEVSIAGRSEGQLYASSGEETSRKLYFGDSRRKCTDTHTGLLRHPDLWAVYPRWGMVWIARCWKVEEPLDWSNMHDGSNCPRCQSSLWGGSGWTWYGVPSSWSLVHWLPPAVRETAHTAATQEPL